MTGETIKSFVLEYTKGIDLINCVDFSIKNKFCKPDDYSNYGCKIDFIKEESSSVKNEEALNEWYIQHHNSFLKSKISKDSPIGFCFPPPYNFISKDEITLNSLTETNSEVEVENNNGNYILNIEKDNGSKNGMIISSIYMKPRWGGNLIKIFE